MLTREQINVIRERCEMLCMLNDEITAERDKYEKYAGELDRAIHGKCEYCKFVSEIKPPFSGSGNKLLSRLCCSRGERWEFDEARVAEDKNDNEVEDEHDG